MLIVEVDVVHSETFQALLTTRSNIFAGSSDYDIPFKIQLDDPELRGELDLLSGQFLQCLEEKHIAVTPPVDQGIAIGKL